MAVNPVYSLPFTLVPLTHSNMLSLLSTSSKKDSFIVNITIYWTVKTDFRPSENVSTTILKGTENST